MRRKADEQQGHQGFQTEQEPEAGPTARRSPGDEISRAIPGDKVEQGQQQAEGCSTSE